MISIPTFENVTTSTWRTVYTSVAISQIISWHNSMSTNLICLRDDNSTSSIRLIMFVVLVPEDPHGLIQPMIVNTQQWLTILNLMMHDRQYDAVQLLCNGDESLRLWFHVFQITLPYTISSVTLTTVYDILMKPRIKWDTKEILNPITVTISYLKVTSHPLQLNCNHVIPISQCWSGL